MEASAADAALIEWVGTVLAHDKLENHLESFQLFPLEASSPPPSSPASNILEGNVFIDTPPVNTGKSVPPKFNLNESPPAGKGAGPPGVPLLTPSFSLDSSAKKSPASKTWADKEEEFGEIEWIIYPWVPARHVTLIFGDPGAAKSSVVVVLAGIVTDGGRLGDEEHEGGGYVGWLDVERTLGANMQRAKKQGISLDKIIDIDMEGHMLDTPEGAVAVFVLIFYYCYCYCYCCCCWLLLLLVATTGCCY